MEGETYSPIYQTSYITNYSSLLILSQSKGKKKKKKKIDK